MIANRYVKLSLLLLLMLVVVMGQVFAQSGEVKTIEVGKIRARVIDNGHQSEYESKMENWYNGVISYELDGERNLNTMFAGYVMRCAGFNIGVRNWNDAVGIVDGTPKVWPYMMAGAELGASDPDRIMFAVPDSKGQTIYKYWRYQPPTITAKDNIKTHNLTKFFDKNNDIVDASKIPGTADVMVESHLRTIIGLDIRQRVFGWSQQNHDDYLVYDLLCTNTGNVDLDDQIELPTNVLDSLYLMRWTFLVPYRVQATMADKEWVSWTVPGYTRPGATAPDSLRVVYSYPIRIGSSTTNDDTGRPIEHSVGGVIKQRRLWNPHFIGEATLFVSKAVGAISNSSSDDDFNQPRMHSVWHNDLIAIKNNVLVNAADAPQKAFDVMKNGPNPYNTGENFTLRPRIPIAGTSHEVPPDDGSVAHVTALPWGPTSRFHAPILYASGPFHLNVGEQIRFVYALAVGTIDKRKAIEVGTNWYAQNTSYAPPAGCVWNANNALRQSNLSMPYKNFPNEYGNSQRNWLKLCWIHTGKDSLMKNVAAAQWNFYSGYNAPAAPIAPNISVEGKVGGILIKWSDNGAEADAAFNGYKVYRAIGSPSDSVWENIYTCTKPNLTYQYFDTTATPSYGYYYYVAAIDNGSKTDFNGPAGVLESGKFLNAVLIPISSFTAPNNDLNKIRVVPNPFNVSGYKYPEENKIMFKNLPETCTIRIFTESGDLVKTIEHQGSGEESWGIQTISNDLQTTEAGLRPVSGVYVAHINTPDGKSKNVKFLIVR